MPISKSIKATCPCCGQRYNAKLRDWNHSWEWTGDTKPRILCQRCKHSERQAGFEEGRRVITKTKSRAKVQKRDRGLTAEQKRRFNLEVEFLAWKERNESISRNLSEKRYL